MKKSIKWADVNISIVNVKCLKIVTEGQTLRRQYICRLRETVAQRSIFFTSTVALR